MSKVLTSWKSQMKKVSTKTKIIRVRFLHLLGLEGSRPNDFISDSKSN